ncbi:MAG: hypothetical protein ACJ8GW_01550 [Massilia sp.]
MISFQSELRAGSPHAECRQVVKIRAVRLGQEQTLIQKSEAMQIRMFLLLCVFLVGAAKADDGPASIPPEQIRGGELVDASNGFAVGFNPSYDWTMHQSGSGYVTRYQGIDSQTGIIYFISIDTRRYPELDKANAEKYQAGMRSGLAASGWNIKRFSLEPSNLPRDNSYLAMNVATHSSGKEATFIEHFTSTGRLYSISAAIPVGQGKEQYQLLLRSFRFLPTQP